MRIPALAAGALAAATLVSACGRPADVRPAAAVVTLAQARILLSDSWVTDGSRGYFVDNAHDASDPAFDLYSTYWRLRLARRTGRAGDGVSARAVRAWIGRALAGNLATSALPAIAQIDYATGILRLLHAAGSATQVARAVGRLRRGGLYRIDATAAPDWGATALAVGVLAGAGAPVPAEVARAVGSQLAGQAPVSDLPEFIAFLQTAGELHRSVTLPLAVRERLVGTAYQALSQAQGTADAAWLVQVDDLRAAARLLGIAVPAVAARTCRMLVGEDGVALPGQGGSDPQATLAALDVGCRLARVPPDPAHGRAGWPTAAATAAAVPASAAAARVARETGALGQFAAPLRREVEQVWVPALRHPASSLAAAAQQSDLRILASLLGGAAAAAARSLPGAPPGGGSDIQMLLYLLDLTYPGPASPELARARAVVLRQAGRPGAPSMIRAAWLELAARLFSDPLLHRRALAIARAQRSSVQAQSDLTGTAIGMWVEQAAWTPAGSSGTAAPPLAAVAVMLAVAHHRFDEVFPVAV